MQWPPAWIPAEMPTQNLRGEPCPECSEPLFFNFFAGEFFCPSCIVDWMKEPALNCVTDPPYICPYCEREITVDEVWTRYSVLATTENGHPGWSVSVHEIPPKLLLSLQRPFGWHMWFVHGFRFKNMSYMFGRQSFDEPWGCETLLCSICESMRPCDKHEKQLRPYEVLSFLFPNWWGTPPSEHWWEKQKQT